jgi:hypothetical protein
MSITNFSAMKFYAQQFCNKTTQASQLENVGAACHGSLTITAFI